MGLCLASARSPVSSLVSGSPVQSQPGTARVLLHSVHTVSRFLHRRDKSEDFPPRLFFSFSLHRDRWHPQNVCFTCEHSLKAAWKGSAFLLCSETGCEEYASLEGSHSSSSYCWKGCQERELDFERNLKCFFPSFQQKNELTIQHLQSVGGQ